MKKLLLLAAGFLLLAAATQAIDAPPMKEGLWSIHTVTSTNLDKQKTEGNQSICRDHAYDDRVRAMAKRPACKTLSEKSSGGTTVIENECTVAGTVVKTKATLTVISENAAHSESYTVYTPPMQGMAEMTRVMDQKYVGPCPAGVVPGDIMGADGKVMVHGKR